MFEYILSIAIIIAFLRQLVSYKNVSLRFRLFTFILETICAFAIILLIVGYFYINLQNILN